MISAAFWGYKLLCRWLWSSLSSFEEIVLKSAFKIYSDCRRLSLLVSVKLVASQIALSLHWTCPLFPLAVDHSFHYFWNGVHIVESGCLGLASSPGLWLYFWLTLLVKELSVLGSRHGGQALHFSQGRVQKLGQKELSGLCSQWYCAQERTIVWVEEGCLCCWVRSADAWLSWTESLWLLASRERELMLLAVSV